MLAHDAPTANFLQPGLLAIGCFATAGVTSWLAQRVAANERLARQRGRELATQTRVNQLVIEDMHDGVVVLDRDGRVVQHNPQAQRLLGEPAAARRELLAEAACPVPGARRGGAATSRCAAATSACGCSTPAPRRCSAVLFIEDTTRAREQAQQLKLAALGRLTANIAHEIRNPLAAISHAAELLSEEKRDEDRDAPDAHHPRQRPAPGPPGRRGAAAQPPRPPAAGADRACGRWLAAFIEEFVANESVPRRALRARGAGRGRRSSSTASTCTR